MALVAAVDYTDHADSVLRAAVALADAYGRDLQVLHCRPGDSDEWTLHSRSFDPQPDRLDRRRLESRVERVLEQTGSSLRPILRLEAPPLSAAIDRLADRTSIDLLVAGASHHGRVAQFLTETTPEGLVRESDAPVLVVPPDLQRLPLDGPILAALDPGNGSRNALQLAVNLARRSGARLVMLDASQRSLVESVESETTSAASQGPPVGRPLHQMLLQVDVRGVDYELSNRDGSRLSAIVDELRAGDYSLCILGRRGRTNLREFFLGTTAYRMLRRLPLPVLVVPDRSEIAGAAMPLLERAYG